MFTRHSHSLAIAMTMTFIVGASSGANAKSLHHGYGKSAKTHSRQALGKALLDAALDDDRGKAEALVAQGADVNYKQPSDGATPLMGPVDTDDSELLEYLIIKGAKANVRTPTGMTPLIAAAINDHVRVINILLNAGADVNARISRNTLPNYKDDIGATALIMVIRNTPENAQSASHQIIQMLLAHSADLSLKDDGGDTALHAAALLDAWAVSELIKHGADVNARDTQGSRH